MPPRLSAPGRPGNSAAVSAVFADAAALEETRCASLLAQVCSASVLGEQIAKAFFRQLLESRHTALRQKAQGAPRFLVELHPLARSPRALLGGGAP